MPANNLARSLATLRGVPYVEPPRPTRPEGLPEPAVRAMTLKLNERPEADLCDALGEWLRRQDWEVWFEVPMDKYRPDVVAIRGEETLAIEAKRLDIHGVIKQGLRLVARFDYPYVALPSRTAKLVALEFARREHFRLVSGKIPPVFPGILAVSVEGVDVLRPASSRPGRRIPSATLRTTAERYGEERGGVPSSDKTARNVDIWLRWVGGERITTLAEDYHISLTAVRTALRRLSAWREHLRICAVWPCANATVEDRQFYGGAHHHHALVISLPDPPERA